MLTNWSASTVTTAYYEWRFVYYTWEESDDPILENEKTLTMRLGNRKELTGLIVSPPRSNVCGIFFLFSVISFNISWRSCPPFFSKWWASLSLKILNLCPILLCSQTSMRREWCDLALGSETLKRAEKRQKTLIKWNIRLDFEYFVSIIFFWSLNEKKNDEDGIRTHACRAHWISSPTP